MRRREGKGVHYKGLRNQRYCLNVKNALSWASLSFKMKLLQYKCMTLLLKRNFYAYQLAGQVFPFTSKLLLYKCNPSFQTETFMYTSFPGQDFSRFLKTQR